MTDPLGAHVRKLIAAYSARHEATLARVAEIEAAGGRIVRAVPVGLAEDWEVRDWRNGTVLAQGDDGYSGYEAARKRLDPEMQWREFGEIADEVIYEHEDLPAPVTEGIPPSLHETLKIWISEPSTPYEDIAQVAGLDLIEVQKYLADR